MLLGFYGDSGSGKTTLIESIITELKKEDEGKNLKIAVVKHIPHKNFSIDDKTKDTGKFRNLSVDVVAFSPDEVAFIVGGMDFNNMISKLDCINDYDIVFVEGLKKEDIPKIRVGNCPVENNTIMDYKNTDSLKKILKWIKENLKKEEMNGMKMK